MEKRFSFGVLRSEQTRLRGIGGTASAVGFGTFAGDAVAVGPVLLNLCGVVSYVELGPHRPSNPASAGAFYST